MNNLHVFIFLLLFSIYKCIEQVEEKQLNRTKQEPFVRRKSQAVLYYSKECQDDIARNCPNSQRIELNDLAVLQCIHNQVSDFNLIDKECHHLMYMVKKNLTSNLRLDNSALSICKEDISKLVECQSVDQINGHLISCLLDNRDNITYQGCKSFLNSVAALVFSDYRLIYNFINDCSADISKFSCGRLEKDDDDNPTQQGKTIECLSKKFAELNGNCKKQILRVTELQSDDFHLDRTLYFACRDDREKLCERIQSGDGRIYKCLIHNKFNSVMSKECQDQLTRRQTIISEDANADKSFIKACKNDILKNQCRKVLRTNDSDSIKLSNLILCLESVSRNGEKLEPECVDELIEHRRQLMSDYKLNPNLVKYCSVEIQKHCNGGIERNGKTVHCLLRNAKRVKMNKDEKDDFSVECIRELKILLKVVDASEDIRVDPDLQDACQPLLNNQCKNIKSGRGRVLNCLMNYLNKPEMSDNCEERLLEIQFFVARDWKLTPGLYRACKNDAVDLCNAKAEWQDWSTDVDNGPLVLPCLFHHIHEDDDSNEQNDKKVSKQCEFEIKQVMNLRAEIVDLVPEIQENCANDLAKFCSKKTAINKGEETRCLQSNLKNLEKDCNEVITQLTSVQSKDLSLDKILMRSCTPTINEYCSDKKEEKGELLECLIKQKNNGKIDGKCRIGIEHHQLLNMQNVEFNYKFKQACKSEISEHCREIQSKIEVVHCLSEIVLNDTLLEYKHRIGDVCRSQLRFELFQLNENINLDPELVKVCSNDINKFCSNVKSGQGKVFECLRTNSKKLSNECNLKLFKRDKINLIEQSGDYNLQTKCKSTIDKFCHVDGDIDIISCLRRQLLKPEFDPVCRQIVINRIIIQNSDVRLNPTLWKACSKDVDLNCKSELVDGKITGELLRGKVIKCLKSKFTEDKLSQPCQLEIEQIMREAANIDYRLDPLLVEGCFNQIETLCSTASNDKKEDCLRLAFQNGKISKDTKCFQEIRRIIIEGAADIFVDHELSQNCGNDLNRFCNDVPPGSAQQLKCLLTLRDTKKAKISQNCIDKLNSRQELWSLVELPDGMTGINDLIVYINNSEHRSYFLVVLSMITFVIFVLGCMCRPVVFRYTRLSDKIK